MSEIPMVNLDMGFDQVAWLRKQYLLRKQRNHSYSLRAFSRDVGIHSGRLSEFFSRKRRLTHQQFRKLVYRLELNTKVAQQLLLNMRIKGKETALKPNATEISEDQAALVSDWQHFAILSLLNTEGFRDSPKWIGKRIGISVSSAQDAIERLARLGFIERKNGKLIRKHIKVTTSEDIASIALRRSHRQSIDKAQKALDQVAVHLREISSITMAIDVKKIPEAKMRIRKFKRSLEKLLETGHRTEVYELNILLTPLTVLKNSN